MDIVIDRKKLFRIQAYFIILIFLLNSLALKLYLYYTIWYFDMFMHFLGGFWVGLFLFWLFSFKNFFSSSLLGISFRLFLGVLAIGVGWEIFEIVFNNIIAGVPFNPLDSISDIFFDLSGGVLAVLYFFKKIMPNRESAVE